MNHPGVPGALSPRQPGTIYRMHSRNHWTLNGKQFFLNSKMMNLWQAARISIAADEATSRVGSQKGPGHRAANHNMGTRQHSQDSLKNSDVTLRLPWVLRDPPEPTDYRVFLIVKEIWTHWCVQG